MHSKEFEAALVEYYEAKRTLDGMDGFGASHPSTYTDSMEDVQKRLTVAKRRIIDAVAGWRPIETAPKDGTEIIGLHGDFFSVPPKRPGYMVASMRFDKGSEELDTDPAWCGPEEEEYTPTHWMPLPQPPEEEND